MRVDREVLKQDLVVRQERELQFLDHAPRTMKNKN